MLKHQSFVTTVLTTMTSLALVTQSIPSPVRRPLYKYEIIFINLPQEINDIIFEFDPTRRNQLTHLCNVLRMYYPFHIRKNMYMHTFSYVEGEFIQRITNQRACINELDIVSGCDNCSNAKAPSLMFNYIKHTSFQNYFGLYCSDCLTNLQKPLRMYM